MRASAAALGLSVVIHAALIAWTLGHDLEQPPAVTPAAQELAIEVVPAKPADPEPVAVALLDDHTVTSSRPVAASTSSHRASLSTGHGHATSQEVAPGHDAHPDVAHSKLMTMRPDPKPALKGPSDDFWKKFEENTKPLQPSAIEGQRLEDDLRSAEDHLGNPRWIANASPDELAAERERVIAARDARDAHELKPKGTGYEAEHATFKGEVEADGTAHLEQKRSWDPTEILMRRNNNDPYAANKRRFLDQTREERYELGKVYKHEQLAQSAVMAQRNLVYLWAHETGERDRKDELFAMWDECAESGPSDLVAGGAAARAQIVGFIRARKSTGELVFTPAELAAYNAKKKSAAAFAPYSD